MDDMNVPSQNIKPQANPQAVARFLGAFIDELFRQGVRDAVVSPGSRSMPLSMMMLQSNIDVHVDVDERGAAFMALGLAKVSGRPVAVICTSGTAVGNWMPAVLEAECSRVPLIFLSGDRPERLQGLGAPQTCDQQHMFGTHVRMFRQMPAAADDATSLAFARQAAREAVIAAMGQGDVGAGGEDGMYGTVRSFEASLPGVPVSPMLDAAPVHINFPFEEPLKPDIHLEDAFASGALSYPYGEEQRVESIHIIQSRVASRHTIGEDDAQSLAVILMSHNCVALCGERTITSPSDAFQVVDWARKFKIPLLADPLSNLRCTDADVVVDAYDSIMRHATTAQENVEDQEACQQLLDDIQVVIRFGRWPVSKPLTSALEKRRLTEGAPIEIVVDPVATRDFNSMTDMFVGVSPLEFIEATFDVVDVFCVDSEGGFALQEDAADLGDVATDTMADSNKEQPSATSPLESAPTLDGTMVLDIDMTPGQMPGTSGVPIPDSRQDWLGRWALVNGLHRARIDDVRTNGPDDFEGSYVAAMLDRTPDATLMVCANSMSIRAIDTFFARRDKWIPLLANRGLNGIDGMTSTAIGAALTCKQTVLLTGDLAFIHDLNALSQQYEFNLLAQEGKDVPSLVIVVLNNSGGAIFDMLPQKSDEPYFKRLFLTPQTVDICAAATAFEVPACSVTTVEEFDAAYTKLLGTPGISLIEVPLPLEGVTSRYHRYW